MSVKGVKQTFQAGTLIVRFLGPLPTSRPTASGQFQPRSRVFPLANVGQRREAMGRSTFDPVDSGPAWNAGRKLGAKRALKPKEIWAIRFVLNQARKVRDRALFDLAIDSKLRGCDLVKVKIGD